MRKLLLAILVLALAPAAVSAQTQKDGWDYLKQLKPGHKIKVVDMDLKAWEGKLVSVSDDAITIREKRKQQEIIVERGRVLRVMDLERSHRARNAAIGFLTGALLFAAATAGEGGDDAERALFIGLFGGIGAGVGAAIPHPRPTIYGTKHDLRKGERPPDATF